MLYFKTTRDANGRVLDAEVLDAERRNGPATDYENRNDWKTMADAEEVAAALGHEYIATDAGPHVRPRYDVIRLPWRGDPVSYAFNGDYYPCGRITRISAGPGYRRIEAIDDACVVHVFWRRRKTGTWLKDGMWSLVAGHVSKRNPEF